jgi:hypothetical protein
MIPAFAVFPPISCPFVAVAIAIARISVAEIAVNLICLSTFAGQLVFPAG